MNKIYPKKVNKRKLKKQFPLLPEEKEKILWKNKLRRERMLTACVSIFLVIMIMILLRVIYLMWNFEWHF